VDLRRLRLVPMLVLAAVALVASGCSSSSAGTSPSGGSSPAGDPNTDKLAQILARGTLVLSTDPLYPPQSFDVKGAKRLTDTKCTPDQMTANQISGYDAETGKLVAEALSVEPCFVVPTWTEITGGNWGDRWDISFGSGSINADRMQRLWMTQPYYAVPNYYFVKKDSPYQKPSDLDGKTIGACASCSHEEYLRGELQIPGVAIKLDVQDPQIKTWTTEVPGLKALSEGKIDAFLCAEPVGQQAIADGEPLRMIPDLAFTFYPSGFVDKGSRLSSTAFAQRVDQIVQAAEADGSLKALSIKYFGKDYATPAASFDMSALNQNIP
jgi:polar amino acid transport system substrate-binding protein